MSIFTGNTAIMPMFGRKKIKLFSTPYFSLLLRFMSILYYVSKEGVAL